MAECTHWPLNYSTLAVCERLVGYSDAKEWGVVDVKFPLHALTGCLRRLPDRYNFGGIAAHC